MTDQPSLQLPADLAHSVRTALAEDVGSGDLTATLIPASRLVSADVVCREAAVIAGAPWFDAVYAELDPSVEVSWQYDDGAAVAPDVVVCTLRGPARAIVTGERTALNFLQTLSGTATVTRRYVDAVAGSPTRILDTRKTLPGLRAAQKYAVRAGGGCNHRMGLFDAVLIKENHIAAAGSIAAAVSAIRERHRGVRIEVEVESLAELEQALSAEADMIMLDEFDLPTLRRATALVAGRATVEISGNVSLERLGELATVGADFISIGSLTKHVRAIDFSMRIQK
ncbi:MAG: carboxylating nicotinate-nucleotide diphosphorylase [Gammaproteobacteria bacterium]